ncbi:MAG: prolipoprotein diacylglyceryl transferase [Deltaproteobacteria bacterium]|nr:prolipoprotein diacylglyceryl transferase [Deltaproteobacteria bacterium]
MHPELFSIGPLTIPTYGFFVAMGFAVALLVTTRIGKAHGLESPQIMDMGFIIILCAIIGSRLGYVLLNPSYYLNQPLDIFKTWEGGLVFSGGIVLVVLVMSWYLKRHNLPYWKTADLWAPGMAIGQAIGRIGCFMAGCCYGQPTDVKWCVVFTHPKSLAPHDICLHPTQLYSSLAGFIIFAILMLLTAKKRFDGQVFIWLIILHSSARLFIERFRGDYRGLIPGTEMSITQLIALLLLIAAVITLFVIKSRRKNDVAPPNTSKQ